MILWTAIIEMVDTVWIICKDNEVKKVFDSSEKAQNYIIDKNDVSYSLVQMDVE
jgi:hypothetical protein